MSSTDNESKLSEALNWLVSLLNRYQIPYQVVGGLAAQVYGARRPLVDIDLYIPMEQLSPALAELEPYMIRKPRPHLSSGWDLTYLVLEYQGQAIQIGDSSSHPRFYNRRDQRWEPQVIDYPTSQKVKLYGVEINVMPRDDLIHYKTLLDRDVDRADLQEMTGLPREDSANYLEQLSPSVTLELDLDVFDYHPFNALISSLQKEGFRFTSMEELGNTEDAQHKLYALNDTTCMELPGSSDEHAWPSFEDFKTDVCQMGWYKPGGQIVAIDTLTGNWAGMCAITRFAGNNYADILHTGVDKRYHGHRLEQAVLVLAQRYALESLKVRYVRSEENAQNLPMLSVYHQLGYT
jgi:RimJ/RimL family protein N-acetyltransferase